MNYYAYLKQIGEGCDYTIGCATILIEIDANSDDEARSKLSEIIKEEYYDDTKLESVKLLKDEIDFDLDNLYIEMEEIKNQEKNKLTHLKDIEEFKRLKAKLKNIDLGE